MIIASDRQQNLSFLSRRMWELLWVFYTSQLYVAPIVQALAEAGLVMIPVALEALTRSLDTQSPSVGWNDLKSLSSILVKTFGCLKVLFKYKFSFWKWNKGLESIFVRSKFESDSVFRLFLKENLGLTQVPVKSKT